MAHKKGTGSTKNGRDSIAKRLGVKLFGKQSTERGNIIIIIIRQHGHRKRLYPVFERTRFSLI